MPKPVSNNRLNVSNIGGIVNRVDTLIDQAVTSNSSPTFGSLCVTGDTVINGNLYVDGNTTVIDSLVSEFQDNIILLNNNELSSGVTLLQAGIEIDRGALENYRIVYNETSKTFRAGPISSTQPVVFREDTPLNNGIMVWNSTSNIIESVNSLKLDVSILSTTNSTNASSGSLWTKGGVGITKDLVINGKINMNGSSIETNTANSLIVSSPQDILFSPSGLINIPNGIPLVFGSTNQSITYNSGTNILKIVSGASVTFEFVNGINHSINIPNQIPLTFSTQNEKIYTDSSNNMVVAGSKDILLNPGSSSYKVLIPASTPLAFGNANVSISANVGGDLSVVSGNNIFLNPNVAGGYVRIPTDNKLKLGGSGNQTVWADSSNNINIRSSNDILVSSNNLILSNGSSIGWENKSFNLNTNGNVILNTGTSGSFVISSTQETTSDTDGALIVSGGLNVRGSLRVNNNIIINSTSGSFNIQKGGNSVFEVDLASAYPSVNIIAGDGTVDNSCLVLSSTTNVAKNLLELSSNNDTVGSYYIGRDTIDGTRNVNVNLPSYAEYDNTGVIPSFSITTDETDTQLFTVETDTGNMNIFGSLILHNTQDSLSTTTGAFILYGGLGVAKNIHTDGTFTCITNNTSAVVVNSTDTSGTVGTLLNIDTENNNIDISCNGFNINSSFYMNSSGSVYLNNTRGVINATTASLVINGGVCINEQMNVNSISRFDDTINVNNNYIINVPDPVNATDVANKGYVDLVKQGLYVKDSVQVASLSAISLNTVIVGTTIDDYTLVNGDRVLIKNQTDAIQNGIYIVNGSNPPTRSVDLDDDMNAAGTFMFIENGTYNANTGWICNTTTSDIVGTDPITFTQFNGTALLVGGAAITKTVNVIDVNVDNFSIEIDTGSDSLRLSSTGLGSGLVGGSGSQLQTASDQSHVNRVGTILSGTWNADNIGVQYGGTGRTQFDNGTILYGNDTGSLQSNYTFVYDDTNMRLGIGINEPAGNIHVSSIDSSVIVVEANSDNSNPNAYPQVLLQNASVNVASMAVSRTSDDFYNDNYPDALLISNMITSGGLTGSSGSIQLATNLTPRLTILRNGYVGINNSAPTSSLDVNGTVTLSDELLSYGNINIANTSESAFYCAGSGSIDGSLSLTSSSDAVSITNGGALTISGGASINKNVLIGESLTVNGDGILNNFIFSSTDGNNYIQAPDENNTLYSLQPIHIVGKDNFNNPITSFSEDGIVLNKNASLCIGGDVNVSGGYTLNFDTTLGNLHVTPYNTSVTNGCMIVGTNGNLSDLKLLGNGGDVYWNSNNNNLNINNASLKINNTLNNPNYSLQINSPDNNGKTIINTNHSNGSLNFSLPTSFSTTSGTGIVSYNPAAGTTGSTLDIGSDVTTVFNGTCVFNGGFASGDNSQTVSLSSGSLIGSSWNYLGYITNVQFDMYSNTYSMHLSASVSGTDLHATHTFDNPSQSIPVVKIYRDDSLNYHGFIQIPQDTRVTLTITNNSTLFNYETEGSGLYPDGSTSDFDNSTWVLVYSTSDNADARTYLGETFVSTVYNSNNTSIVSYNNTEGSKDLGISLQRYQLTNDTSLGDVIGDSPSLTTVLPSQTTININQIRITGGSAVNDYYKNWWVKSDTQVRKVTAYSALQGIATLDSDWTTQPTLGDTVNMYNNNYIVYGYNESDHAVSFSYASDVSGNTISSNSYLDIKTKDIYCSDVHANGKVIISDTSDVASFTNGGSLTVLGGACISKTLLVGNNICMNDNNQSFSPSASIHINNRNNNSTILLENNNTSGNCNSSIGFKNTTVNYTLQLNNTSNSLNLTNNTNAYTSLSFNSSGNMGIGTSTIVSPLTIANGNLISVDTDDSYLGLNAGNSNTINDGNAQCVLYGTNSSVSSGNINMYLGGTSGNFNIISNTGSSIGTLLNVTNNGVVTINNTQSSSVDSAALLVNGGLTVSCTTDATSITSGGGITVMGGLSVVKDFYIGGNLHVAGELNATGSITQPTITFSDPVNCTVTNSGNVNLNTVSTQGVLTFYVNVTPTVTRDYCQFTFSLPNKVANLINRGDCIINVSGWSDDTDVIPLFNVIGVGIPGTKTAMVKFANINTSLHYFQISCTYTF
mgnify:CR=1 FL=1|jgi:hypothetical protein